MSETANFSLIDKHGDFRFAEVGSVWFHNSLMPTMDDKHEDHLVRALRVFENPDNHVAWFADLGSNILKLDNGTYSKLTAGKHLIFRYKILTLDWTGTAKVGWIQQTGSLTRLY